MVRFRDGRTKTGIRTLPALMDEKRFLSEVKQQLQNGFQYKTGDGHEAWIPGTMISEVEFRKNEVEPPEESPDDRIRQAVRRLMEAIYFGIKHEAACHEVLHILDPDTSEILADQSAEAAYHRVFWEEEDEE